MTTAYAHNSAAKAAAELQLAAGEITQDDFDWLFGKRKPTKFLVPYKSKSKVHLWDGKDTLCRMASTGGVDPLRYRVMKKNPGRGVCANCSMVAE